MNFLKCETTIPDKRTRISYVLRPINEGRDKYWHGGGGGGLVALSQSHSERDSSGNCQLWDVMTCQITEYISNISIAAS